MGLRLLNDFLIVFGLSFVKLNELSGISNTLLSTDTS